jgi:SAM-dependent methyltransferase
MNQVTGSISFDRAAEYYDRTRALPAGLAARQTELLFGILTGRRRLLEIGVGTGRIALPLWHRGIPIIGLDLSAPMLRRLRANAAGSHFPLVLGDATRLPFGDTTLDAVVAAHVLHLIPEWQRAVAEAHRVLGSGGVFLQTRGTPWGLRSEVSKVFFEGSGKPDWPPGATGNNQVDKAAADTGFEVEELDELRAPTRIDLYEMVDQLEQGLFSACWELDAERRATAAAAARAWLQRQHGAPPAWVDDTLVLRWTLYRKR